MWEHGVREQRRETSEAMVVAVGVLPRRLMSEFRAVVLAQLHSGLFSSPNDAGPT